MKTKPIKNALPPKLIWLQWDGNQNEGSPIPIEKRGEISWCQDKIWERDVQYIRLDEVKRRVAKAIEKGMRLSRRNSSYL